MKELLQKFLNQHVKLIKDDNFVIDGVIKEISDDAILFFSDGRDLLISFSRIKEIRPMRRRM